MKELFIVTHPEATHHIEGRVGGWSESELTDRGREQVCRIAEVLALRVSQGSPIFSSDLRRAQQTAATIAHHLGSTPREMMELREKSYGEGNGQTDSWFRHRFIPPPECGERMNHYEGIVGSESKLEWARRVYDGMEDVMKHPSPQKIVVTHGGTASLVISNWIGIPLDNLGVVAFQIESGSITHLRQDDYFHNHSVFRLNETTHLGR